MDEYACLLLLVNTSKYTHIYEHSDDSKQTRSVVSILYNNYSIYIKTRFKQMFVTARKKQI